MWLSSDKRGGCSKLDNPARAALRAVGEEVADDDDGATEPSSACLSVPFRIAVLEVKGVLGPVGADVGLQVSPPIGPQSSHHFQLLEPDLASWLFSVLQAKHVRSLLLEKQVARAILLFRFACREGLPALLMVPMRSAWVGGDAWNRAACGHGATWTLSLCH